MNATAELRKLVVSNPEVMSGAPLFVGTHVPMQWLFNHLEGGGDLDEFLARFPEVSRSQALQTLEVAKDSLVESVTAFSA